MEVLSIDDIERKALAVSYRRAYHGTAVLKVGQNPKNSKRIEFTLEQSPMGTHEVHVSFLEDADFPLVPAIRALKSYIEALHAEGSLP
ncbi:MAG: hypothetical protein ACOC28_01740 [Alkalispirochaetaceae bacterium]